MRRALVTGSSSGIGEAIARRLTKEGWAVAGLDVNPPTNAAPGFLGVEVDLTDPAARAAAFDGLAEHGPFHALIHAAGIMRGGPLGDLDAEDGARMWRLHVEAATAMADWFAPCMPTGGRILLLGSRASKGVALKSQYGATKAALVALARAWGKELAPRRITVNVIAPAAVDTPMLRDPARSEVPPAALPPLGRLVTSEEVAALAAFLLGPEAGAITGQEIMICGGASL